MLRKDDVEGILVQHLGYKGIEILSENNAWDDFTEFAEFLGQIHEDVLQPEATRYDAKELHHLYTMLDEEIIKLMKKVKLKNGISLYHIYGERRSVHPAYSIFARGLDVFILAALLKLFNLLKPELGFQDIRNVKRVTEEGVKRG